MAGQKFMPNSVAKITACHPSSAGYAGDVWPKQPVGQIWISACCLICLCLCGKLPQPSSGLELHMWLLQAPKDFPWRYMKHNAMTPHMAGASVCGSSSLMARV